jgi:hypothetical protein
MFARFEIAPGVTFDVHDLHADAGSDEASMEARRRNLTQLLKLIEDRSSGRAVVVMGDFNSRYTRNGDIAEQIREAGFQDSWLNRNEWPTPRLGPSVNSSIRSISVGQMTLTSHLWTIMFLSMSLWTLRENHCQITRQWPRSFSSVFNPDRRI